MEMGKVVGRCRREAKSEWRSQVATFEGRNVVGWPRQ